MTKDKRRPMETMLDAGYVQKTGYNDHFKYYFASEAEVSSKIRETMAIAGLWVKSCEVLNIEHTSYSNAKGAPINYCTCLVSIHLEDRDGVIYGPYQGMGAAADTGDKSAMKAMTAARKYAISTCCLLSWGDDPEADTTVDKHATSEPSPATAQDPPGLSDDEYAALEVMASYADQGISELKKAWVELVDTNIQASLARTPEWKAIKDRAAAADDAREGGSDGYDDGGVQGEEG